MNVDDVFRDFVPRERQTKLCDDMIAAIETSEHKDEDDRVIIFISNNKEKRAGLVMSGYGEDGDMEAVVDLFAHLAAILEANGKKLHVIAMPQQPPLNGI